MGHIDEAINSIDWCSMGDKGCEIELRNTLTKLFSSDSSSKEMNERLTKLLFVKMSYKAEYKEDPSKLLEELKLAGPRQVCQYQFKRNDIVWLCRTCQSDETCVQCNACFNDASHEGHEVYFYHSQSGGCCDCGDPEAWLPIGYCPRHGCRHADADKLVDPAVSFAGELIFDFLANQIVDIASSYAESQTIAWLKNSGTVLSHLSIASLSALELGVYFVLHLDDVNNDLESIRKNVTTTLTNEVFYRERLMTSDIGPDILAELEGDVNRLMTTLQADGNGSLGPFEPSQASRIACTLASHGLRVAVITGPTLTRMRMLVHAITWLTEVSQVSDGMCQMICAAFTNERLCQIMCNDTRLPKVFLSSLHPMFLTLLANQAFKSNVAMAYAQAIPCYAESFGAGVGNIETSLFGISVQFLNRVGIVSEMEKRHGFLRNASGALRAMLESTNCDMNSPILSHRRYNPLVGDLRVAFSLDGISKQFCTTCLYDWYRILVRFHAMHMQERQTQTHVLHEEKIWIHAFNLSLALVSLFEPMLGWINDTKKTIGADTLPTLEDIRRAYPALYETNNGLIDTPSHLKGLLTLSEALPKVDNFVLKTELWVDGAPTALTLLLDTYQLLVGLYPAPRGSWGNSSNQERTFLSPMMEMHTGSSDRASFHPLIFRFLGAALRECCSHEGHTSTLDFLLQYLRDEYTRTPQRSFALADASIRQLCFASEISVGLWARNGQVMNEQVLNYAEAPYCRNFRDVDILLLQFVAVYYQEHLVQHIFARFQVLSSASMEHWLGIARQNHPSLSVYESLSIRSAFMNGVMEYPKLLQEALTTIIMLVTELPLPPGGCENTVQRRVTRMIRREIVHNLACGPCAYSQLHDCASIVADHDKVSSKLIDEVIMSVAEWLPSTSMEPSQLALRPECWRLYVPTFPHVHSRMHEKIFENRPKLTSRGPMIPCDEGVHPIFANVRMGVLLDKHLLALLHCMLNVCASERTSSANQSLFEVPASCPLKCPSTDLSHVINLLTLMLHEVNRSNTGEGGSGSAGQKAALAAFMSGRDHAMVPATWVVPDEEHATRSGDDGQMSKRLSQHRISLVAPLECLLEILFSLMSSKEDVNLMHWVEWVCTEAGELSDSCRELRSSVEARLKEGQDKSCLASLRERRRLIAMRRLKASARAFEEKMAVDGEAEERDTEEELGESTHTSSKTGTSKKHRPSYSGESEMEADVDGKAAVCIVCHEQRAEALGYLGFSQSSSSRLHTLPSSSGPPKLCEIICQNRPSAASAGAALYVTGSDVQSQNLFLQHCGHAMHYSCFDVYFASAVQKSEQQDDLILDTSCGQFQCPLCKRLGNFMLPVLPTSSQRKRERLNPAGTVTPMQIQTSPPSSDDRAMACRDDDLTMKGATGTSSSCVPALALWWGDSGADCIASAWDVWLEGGRGSPRLVQHVRRGSLGAASAASPDGSSCSGTTPPSSQLYPRCSRSPTVSPGGSDGEVSPPAAAVYRRSPREADVPSSPASSTSTSDTNDEQAPSSMFTARSAISATFERFMGLFDRSSSRAQSDATPPPQPLPTPPSTSIHRTANDDQISPLRDNVRSTIAAWEATLVMNRKEEQMRHGRVSKFWMRFLHDVTEPLQRNGDGLGAPAQGSHPNERTLREIAVLLHGIGFTCAIDAAERGVGAHLREGQGRRSGDFSHMGTTTDALRHCVSDMGIRDRLHDNLMDALTSRKPSRDWLFPGEPVLLKHWLARPLLQRPLMDCLVLGVVVCDDEGTGGTAAGMSDERSGNLGGSGGGGGGGGSCDASSTLALVYLFQWLCIARLVQLVLAVQADDVLDTSPLAGQEEGGDEQWPLLQRMCGWTVSLDGDAASLSSTSAPSVHLSSVTCRQIMRDWLDFVSTAAHLLHRCRPGLLPVPELPVPGDARDSSPSTPTATPPLTPVKGDPSAHRLSSTPVGRGVAGTSAAPTSEVEVFQRAVALGVDMTWAEATPPSPMTEEGDTPSSPMTEEGGTPSDSRAPPRGPRPHRGHVQVQRAAVAWISAVWTRVYHDNSDDDDEDDEVDGDDDDPNRTRRPWRTHVRAISQLSTKLYSTAPTSLPILDMLPKSYTELHGIVAKLQPPEYPAICLACGMMLDAGGLGKCTAHARECCQDGAVFFLVQDCLVLLVHGSRASYFSPPYVDQHGERHKNYRGRPLNIDQKRSEVLRSLWALHGVPHEVVLKRSISTRVIINGHY